MPGTALLLLAAAQGWGAQVLSRTALETVDGEPIRAVVSEDGAHYAYAAKIDGETVWLWNKRRAGPGSLDQEALLSPDGSRFAFVSRGSGGARLYLDAEPKGDYASAEQLLFSADSSHLAYVAVPQDEGWTTRVFKDGSPGPPLESAGSLQFSPNNESLAYAGTAPGVGTGKVTRLYLDHKPIRELPPDASARFSEDWKKLAYWQGEASWAEDGGVVFVDDRLLAKFSWCRIPDVTFSPSGTPAFVTFCNGKGGQVHMGREPLGPSFAEDNRRHDRPIVRYSRFSDRPHWFGDSRLFVNGREAGHWVKIASNLALSLSGGRTAFVAKNRRGIFVLVEDGRETPITPSLLDNARVVFEGEDTVRYLEYSKGKIFLTRVRLDPLDESKRR